MAPERDAADASDLEAFVERSRSPEEIERLRLEALPPDEYEVEIQILENSKKDLRTPEKRANDRRRADRERQRAWREANPEKVAQQHREWAAKNPERQRKHGRDYYYRNRETFKERDDRRAATTAGRAKKAEAQRKWRAKGDNRERVNELNRRRRADPEYRAELYRLQAERRRLDRRLKDAGLPPRRLRRVYAAEKRQNAKSAAEFFAEPRTRGYVARLLRELEPNRQQRIDTLQKSPAATLASVTAQARLPETRDALVRTLLVHHEERLREHVARQNAQRAALGRSTDRVDDVVPRIADRIVDTYLASPAAKPIQNVDPERFRRYIGPRIDGSSHLSV